MILWVILGGILVGLTSGLPFGPVGALCIKKSLSNKKRGGYITGFGAAITDGIFALIASFGIVAISKFLIENEPLIKSIGGLFLIGVGLKEFGKKEIITDREPSTKREFLSGITIALASPFVILSFFALYAILGMGSISGNYSLSLVLAASTFSGAFLGVTLLNFFVIKNKYKISPKKIEKINALLGLLILGTGIYFVLKWMIF